MPNDTEGTAALARRFAELAGYGLREGHRGWYLPDGTFVHESILWAHTGDAILAVAEEMERRGYDYELLKAEGSYWAAFRRRIPPGFGQNGPEPVTTPLDAVLLAANAALEGEKGNG